VTDLVNGWTECLASPDKKKQKATHKAIQLINRLVPFPVLGLHLYNGSEFINHINSRYCLSQEITIIRSKPYSKNDQVHVEQKNWSVVRHVVGYDRFESPDELALLSAIYDHLLLFVNFLKPV